MFCSYRAPSEENKAASSHGPAGDQVEWVFAESTSTVAAQYVKPVHTNLCHDTARGTTILGNQAHRKTFAWHKKKDLKSKDPWICYKATNAGIVTSVGNLVKYKYLIYNASRAWSEG
jgi:hypothetical protein